SLGLLSPEISEAIYVASQELLGDDFMEHFPVDVYQTGSGTSSNMNANEVIANIASKQSGQTVSPNDHVNYGQSSNDIIPTCIHVSAVKEIKAKLLPSLVHLAKSISVKAKESKSFIKTGRTHLMDAMPIRFDQCLSAWETQINQNIDLIELMIPKLSLLAQGGTAIGTGINAHPKFSEEFCKEMSNLTGHQFKSSDNFFSQLGSQDTIVALSGHLKTTAVSMMKIANDLRWMNSGPLAGLGEIELEALQPGSSIMPGKVNPVIPEATAMVCAQVIGNDAAITIGGQSGNFELNVMLPMICENILSSLELLANTALILSDKAIKSFVVNEDQILKALSRNPILVTALNPIIGYLKAAEIAKKAYKERLPVIDVAERETDIPRSELEKLLDPKKLTEGGIP
ncbi:MAG: class II fumarate hydratase, partial [Pseudomonadota bacterium]|nr:class II fumarate hydratase [Pseudomonadota bacterium]